MGIHHICRLSTDYEADKAKLESLGSTVATEGKIFGLPFCYVDARQELGCLVELATNSPFIRGLHEVVAAAAADWDGTEPTRPLQL